MSIKSANLVANKIAPNECRLRLKGESVGTEPVRIIKQCSNSIVVVHYFGKTPQVKYFDTLRPAAIYAISLFNRVVL